MGKNKRLKKSLEYKQYRSNKIEKQRIHPIVSTGYTHSQMQAFRRIKRNTFVVCKMPLNIESMVEVSRRHRSRPYLIVAKDKDSIYGYKMTSSDLRDKGVPQFVIEDFKKGKKGPSATSYVNLDKTYRIPIQNIRKIGDPVDEDILVILQRSLYAGINRGDQNLLPIKGVKPLLLPGDIIKLDDSYYYIYDFQMIEDTRKHPEFTILPCVKQNIKVNEESIEKFKDVPTVIRIPGTEDFWEVDTTSFGKLSKSSMKLLVGFAPKEKIGKIAELYQENFEEKEERTNENEEINV